MAPLIKDFLALALFTVMSSVGCTANAPAAGGRYSELVLSDKPIAYWRLNEIEGNTAVDAGPSRINGTYTKVKLGQPGASPETSSVRFTSEREMPAVGSITLPSDSVFKSLSGDFTAEAWVHVDSYASADVGCGNYTYGNDAILAFGKATEFEFGIAPPAGLPYVTFLGRTIYSQPFKPGPIPGWLHLAFARSGATYTFFVNGEPNSKGQISAGKISLAGAERKIGLGNTGELNSPFVGSMHDIAFYGAALPASRIKTHFDFYNAQWQASSVIYKTKRRLQSLFQ